MTAGLFLPRLSVCGPDGYAGIPGFRPKLLECGQNVAGAATMGFLMDIFMLKIK